MTPEDDTNLNTKPTTCKCGNNPPSDEPHYCPYALEVHDDRSDDYCWCCDECMDTCYFDI